MSKGIPHYQINIPIRQNISARDLSTVLLMSGLLIVYFLPTDFLFNNPTSFCIHKNLLRFDCPGCGMTRALHCLLHGHFKQAIFYNIGIILLAFFIAQQLFYYFIPANFNKTLTNVLVFILSTTLLTQYIFKVINHFY